jgi:hypothetical protein
MPKRFQIVVVLAVGALIVGVAIFFSWRQEAPPKTDPHFRDVAAESGITWRMRFLTGEQGETYKINLYDHGSGVAVGDFDGDGYDDIYFVNQLGKNALYRNRGDGTFDDVTDRAGVGLGDRICVGATFVDYDNSGRRSLFVTSTRGGNVLFRNKGDGTFEDVTKEAGVAHVGHSQAGIFFDYDADGYLDLLLLQTASWTTEHHNPQANYYDGKGSGNGLLDTAASPVEHNILYHNETDGKGGRQFAAVSGGGRPSGLEGSGWAGDAAVLDANGDNKPDVLITCMFGPSRLYRNEGGGHFKEADTKKILGRTSAGGMGVRAFGARNNGLLDIFIVDMHSDMWMPSKYDLSKIDEKKKFRYMFIPEAGYNNPKALEFEKQITDRIRLPYDDVLFGNTFHRNLGNGHYLEESDRVGLETLWPWGIATGDFDNDGFEDLFLPSGMGYPWEYWPNRLLMNKGDGTFVERSREEGIEPPARGLYLDETVRNQQMPRSSRAAAVADFRGYGRLDIVVNNFNDQPYLFRNDFPTKNWISFRLHGAGAPRSNRDAIGAVVRLYVGDQIMTRQVNSAAGYLSQSSATTHFGLGDRMEIDHVEIQWPSGVKQTLSGLIINKRHDVNEPRP